MQNAIKTAGNATKTRPWPAGVIRRFRRRIPVRPLGYMKLVRPIDLVLLISLALYITFGAVVHFNGGVGPCGPSTDSAVVAYCWIPGMPLAFLGIITGAILSLISAFRRPRKSDDTTEPKK